MKKPAHSTDTPVERLSGSVERVTFHSEESGFCVLRAKVRGQHELVTVISSAASITAGEYIECLGIWTNDRTHGMQFKSHNIRATKGAGNGGQEQEVEQEVNQIGCPYRWWMTLLNNESYHLINLNP